MQGRSMISDRLDFLYTGVPLKTPVAGVAMGLILETDGRFVILTDILGSEDALGDMDFKVAGSADGVTAFQMDIKVLRPRDPTCIPCHAGRLPKGCKPRRINHKIAGSVCNLHPASLDGSPIAKSIGCYAKDTNRTPIWVSFACSQCLGRAHPRPFLKAHQDRTLFGCRWRASRWTSCSRRWGRPATAAATSWPPCSSARRRRGGNCHCTPPASAACR